ncbi:colanic acid biosynthesis glycosyltransferase WcaL [Oligella urethralis]|uniref:glycosyltransferase n=1 Tax=Oligella urethralis TaxID=90245 RepID=UPI000DFF556A|nr:glycosyltransferase [Oligella urethralis]SUA56888.1 colanic acid biosynthesis glycosyltransferase WcaL [Oligella urethralis]
MKNLIVLTLNFPYEGGEQFVETEARYWANTKFDKIYLLPNSKKGELREFPSEVSFLSSKKDNKKIIYILLSLFNSIFYSEISFILKNTKYKYWLFNIWKALKSTSILIKKRRQIKVSLHELKNDENFVYSYWNNEIAYAACLLKKEGIVDKVISRAHGYDLYEDRHRFAYMPLKRQFTGQFDKVFLLSENAKKYFGKTYNVSGNKLGIARLGVTVPQKLNVSRYDFKNKISILSLSYCVPVKQIELIMKALVKYSYDSEILIEWTHIGGGELFEKLKTEASEIELSVANLEINFVGQKTNQDVLDFLKKEQIDLFINASKSEGIPVSIMEAMAHGIPAIAPNIGGIADLVNKDNGYLMPTVCDELDIIKGINYIVDNKDKIDFTLNAYNWVKRYFNSEVNYPLFINELEAIAKINEK